MLIVLFLGELLRVKIVLLLGEHERVYLCRCLKMEQKPWTSFA